MTDPIETAELLAFTRVVEASSLTRAASELRVPRATISRRLARLEERLGVRLLRRTTRSLALTDAGEALYRHARVALDAVASAEASVRRPDGAISGELRVSTPMIPHFFEALTAFAKDHPKVRLQVHASTRLVDLRREPYDVAIRAASDLPPGLIARNLFRSEIVAVASPGYLAEHGTPRTAKDLRDHRCLMGFARGELPETHWRIDGRELHLDGAFFTNDPYLRCAAAASGLGIAPVARVFAEDGLESGALVRVLERARFGSDTVAVVYLDRELQPPQVRAFVDAIARWKPTDPTDRPPPDAPGGPAPRSAAR